MDPTQKCVYCGGGLDFGGTIVHQPNCPSWRRSQSAMSPDPVLEQAKESPNPSPNPFAGLGAMKRVDGIEESIRRICREEIQNDRALAEQYRTFVGQLGATETHDWRCACGHWNGPSLAECGQCRRRPGEIL